MSHRARTTAAPAPALYVTDDDLWLIVAAASAAQVPVNTVLEVIARGDWKRDLANSSRTGRRRWLRWPRTAGER